MPLSSPAIATIIHQFGRADEVIEIYDQALPQPAADEVVVQMQMSAINPSDLITISGAYRSRIALPFQPGYEGVGVVIACGDRVAHLRPGMRVLPIGIAGSWSCYKVTPAHWCFPISDQLSTEQAATLYVNPATAWLMLHERAQVQPGMNIVISAGASAIGRMMIRMLNRLGIKPIVTIRNRTSMLRLQAFALEAMLVTDEPDFDKALKPQSVDLVLDAVGGAIGARLAQALKPGGQFIHYGLLSGQPLPSHIHTLVADMRFELFVLRNWIHQAEKSRIHELFQTLEPLMLADIVSSDIDSIMPLADIHWALARVNDNEHKGKVLLRNL